MATPGLRALRKAYPEAWIVGQLPVGLAPLLAGSESFDEIWPVVPRRSGYSRLHVEAKRLAEARFDLGIVIPESISSALSMRWGRVGRVTGFARDPLRRWLLHEVAVAPQAWGRRRLVSRERFVLELMAAIGVESDDLTLGLVVTDGEEARLDAVLAEDRFAARGRRVILVGAPGEHLRLEAVRASMKSRPLVLDGVLDLGSLKALIRRAGLLVANDAGARHIAAAFDIPSVIFFGPTSVNKTADNLTAIEILETEYDCRPCYLRSCPIDHRCLRSITVADADDAVSRTLAREGGKARARPAFGATA